jgi:hypothetical protein
LRSDHSVGDGGDGRLAIVVALDFRHDSLSHDVRLIEVGFASFAGVRPLNVESDGDPASTDHRVGDLTVNTFAQKPTERGDHVGSASASVGIVIIAPTRLDREDSSERIKVLSGERGAKFVCNVLRCPKLDRKLETTTCVAAAGHDPNPLSD